MIDLSKLAAVKTIVTHDKSPDGCPDGIASAIILRDVLPTADVVWLQSGALEFEETRLPPDVAAAQAEGRGA